MKDNVRMVYTKKLAHSREEFDSLYSYWDMRHRTTRLLSDLWGKRYWLYVITAHPITHRITKLFLN